MIGRRTLLALAALALALTACSSASHTSTKTATPHAAVSTPVSPPNSGSPVVATPPMPYWVRPGVSFVDGRHGWLTRGTATGGALLVTQDGGQTWSTESLGSLVPSAVAFIDPMHGWVAGTSSPDGCGSPPVPCYALETTADGGHTWTVVKLPEHQPVTQIALASPKDAWILQEYCNDADCARFTAEIYRTVNGGITWHPVDPPGEQVMQLVRTSDGTSWVISESYVFRTTDGINWAGANNPCHLLQPPWKYPIFDNGPASFADSTHGWIACPGPAVGHGMNPGILYRTEDGGITWTLVSATPELALPVPPAVGDFPGNIEDIRFYDATDGWLAGGYQSGMFRTMDGGHTWHLVQITTGLNDVVFASATGTCAMNDGQLACSTDGGQHWAIHDLPH